MEKLAKSICDIFYDYHSFNGFKFTPDHVIKWVSQFDDKDQHFILKEFYHLCSNNKIYVSESGANEMFLQLIKTLAKEYQFKNEISFLKNVDFLKMQDEDNSQTNLLEMVNDLTLN